MASKQRARKSRGAIPFNALTWSQTIPFSDDLWLGMQARNLALVDMGFIRDVEQQALQEYIAEMRTPAMTLMFLSALSQMWIFAVYEFLRTWRERAKHLIKIADEYEKVLPRKRAKFMQAVIANAKGKENKIKIAMTFLSHYVSKIPDEAFMDNVRAYFKKNDGLFRQIEGLRVTLAKHQIPGGRGLIAEAPGYARMSYENGSLYWHYLDKEGFTERVERRKIADEFFDLKE